MDKLLEKVLAFQRATGLGDHRVGILLAKNGRLIERLRENRPFQSDTIEKITKNIQEQAAKRSLPKIAEKEAAE